MAIMRWLIPAILALIMFILAIGQGYGLIYGSDPEAPSWQKFLFGT